MVLNVVLGIDEIKMKILKQDEVLLEYVVCICCVNVKVLRPSFLMDEMVCCKVSLRYRRYLHRIVKPR